MRLDTCRTLSSRHVTWRLAQSSCMDKGGEDRPAGKTNVVPRYMHVRILLFAMDCSIETGVCDRYSSPIRSDSAIRAARHASARWLAQKILGSPVAPELMK